jgi:hexosaminidase
MRKIIFLFLILISFQISAQEISIIPQPVSLQFKAQEKPFQLDITTSLYTDFGGNACISFLDEYLTKNYHLKLKWFKNPDIKRKNMINLIIDPLKVKTNQYQLNSNQN